MDQDSINSTDGSAPRSVLAALTAAITGLIRMFIGVGAPAGTLVNIAWVTFDFVLLSVIIRVAPYKGYTPTENNEK